MREVIRLNAIARGSKILEKESLRILQAIKDDNQKEVQAEIMKEYGSTYGAVIVVAANSAIEKVLGYKGNLESN